MNTPGIAEITEAQGSRNGSRGALIVSIHDVAPATQRAVRRILAELSGIGCERCSLLVVPDYHHQGLFSSDLKFVDWLREQQSNGHEIVIHGYYHERRRRTGEPLRQRFMTRVYTADEGEFYDAAYDESLRLISSAKQEFERFEIRPVGFIAPAWLLGAESERAVPQAGLSYTTRIGSVRDFVRLQTFPSRSLVWSTRAGWRRAASLVWNAALFARVNTEPLVRVAIHPPDAGYPRIWRQILRQVESLASSRTATTYRDWLTEQRQHEAAEERATS